MKGSGLTGRAHTVELLGFSGPNACFTIEFFALCTDTAGGNEIVAQFESD